MKTLSTYINNLQNLLDKHGDIPIVYSSDDEGNYYDYVHYDPEAGMFNGTDYVGDTDEDYESSGFEPVICIN